MRRAFSIFIILTCFSFNIAAQQPEGLPVPTLVRISPAGQDVPATREIVFQFSAPVVPVGRMERGADEVPVKLTPAVNCKWIWLNTSSLSCQLDEKDALRPATKYRIAANREVNGEEGKRLLPTIEKYVSASPPARSSFTTQLPKVTSWNLRKWLSPGTPAIVVYFNSPVTRDSVSEHLFFLSPSGKRFGVNISSADEEESVPESSLVYRISPLKELPLDSSTTFHQEPGLKFASGGLGSSEDRVIVAFDTFPPFRFLGIKCCRPDLKHSDDCWNGTSFAIRPGEAWGDRLCNPQDRISMLFSRPVPSKNLEQGIESKPPLFSKEKEPETESDAAGEAESGDQEEPEEDEMEYYFYNESPHKKGREYETMLPYGLKAVSEYSLRAGKGRLQDMFGEALDGDLSAVVKTDHRVPRLVFDHGFSVLEKNENTHLPVAVQNLDSLHIDYSLLSADGATTGLRRDIPVDKPLDLSYYFPLRVREMIPNMSGVLFGTLSASPQPMMSSIPVRGLFVTQVTPFHVHAKIGFHNTLVWVTSLDKGEPVVGARVAAYKESPCSYEAQPLVQGEAVTGKDGIAVLPGRSILDPFPSREWERCAVRLKIRVQNGKDLGFLPLIDELQMMPGASGGRWIDTETMPRFGHIRAWGTTPQGLYKLGQTMQYKIYVRDQGNDTFVPAPAGSYSLSVIDPTGKTVEERSNVKLSDFGAIDGEFAVPENGAVGWYRFVLKGKFAGDEDSPPGDNDSWLMQRARQWEPMQVLVSDFTPASFKVATEIRGSLFRIGDEMPVLSSASLYSGGPYAKAQARVSAMIVKRDPAEDFPKYKGYSFSSSTFGGNDWDTGTVEQKESALDEQGRLDSVFTLSDQNVPAGYLYGRLTVETAVRDDRGKYIASSASAKFAGRDRFVGIRFNEWLFDQGKPLTAQAVVIDPDGRMLPGIPVNLTLKRKKVMASRVKGPGNAYTTHYESSWEEVEKREVTSSNEPLAVSFTVKQPGEYSLEAVVKDSAGREHMSSYWTWVYGRGEMLWEQEDGNRMDIMPETTEAKSGDNLRVLVKNPFPGGRALVTVERFGVIKKWVQTLQSASEIVNVPITDEMIPGFYLSVVVMSPRVDKPLEEGNVDLGKPAVRMGYATINVRDKSKELSISVTADREVYRPGEQVNVKLKASGKGAAAQPIEYAVAVLDESVFDLVKSGRENFDPYSGFYRLDALDVENFNILLDLVGRRKFEKKGANSGGDGMDLGKRSDFKLLAYWNPALRADAGGNASFSFAVPDNLTAWKILAIATTPGDRFGLGAASVKVNRPTEIQPALVNQVIEGDSFDAAFSVMNRTDASRTLNVEVKAAGPVQTAGQSSFSIEAKPYDRVMVRYPVKSSKDGTIIFSVRAGDKTDTDSVEFKVPIGKAMSLITSATYGTFDGDKATELFKIPADIRTDAGSIGARISPSVISSVEGAFRYMTYYPYSCWEQRLTKGVMAGFYKALKNYMPGDFKWQGSDSLPRETLDLAQSYQAPNGGMAYYIAGDEYADPYLSAYTAVAFNWLRNLGYPIPGKVEEKLDGYLQGLLRSNSFPSFYSPGMSSTTRAVALAALAQRGKVTREDVERYIPTVPQMSLIGKASVALALARFDSEGNMLRDLIQKIYAAANETGGKFMFNESIDTTTFERILTTPLRDNCAVLSAFIAFNDFNARNKQEDPGYGKDVPFKLVRTITQTRKGRDYWENTQENVFCMNSLVEYSKAFEAVPPDGTWGVELAGERLGEASFHDLRAEAASIMRPIRQSDPGKDETLTIRKNGKGRVYYSARLLRYPSAIASSPSNAGIEVRREYQVERNGKWELLNSPFVIRPGELVRVDLYVSIPAARNFVVVNDPVPGGLEPVNRDLATTSAVDAAKGDVPLSGGSWWYRFNDWHDFATSRWSFYHRELRHDSARFYSEYLSPGNYHLGYTAQAIASGEFTVLPTRAEEMYDPEVYGIWVPEVLKVAN